MRAEIKETEVEMLDFPRAHGEAHLASALSVIRAKGPQLLLRTSGLGSLTVDERAPLPPPRSFAGTGLGRELLFELASL
eukprot:3901328-Prymnesium_polylepis.2